MYLKLKTNLYTKISVDDLKKTAKTLINVFIYFKFQNVIIKKYSSYTYFSYIHNLYKSPNTSSS